MLRGLGEGAAHVDQVVVVLRKPRVRLIQQLLLRPAAMIPRDRLFQMPQTRSIGGRLRGVGRQITQLKSTSLTAQILPDVPAPVKGGIVADHVYPFPTPEPPSVRGTDQQSPRLPHQRSCQMTLAVVSRCGGFRLLTPRHPHRTDLRIQMHVQFILKHRHFVRREIGQQRLNFPEFPGMFRIGGTDLRTGTTPNEP